MLFILDDLTTISTTTKFDPWIFFDGILAGLAIVLLTYVLVIIWQRCRPSNKIERLAIRFYDFACSAGWLTIVIFSMVIAILGFAIILWARLTDDNELSTIGTLFIGSAIVPMAQRISTWLSPLITKDSVYIYSFNCGDGFPQKRAQLANMIQGIQEKWKKNSELKYNEKHIDIDKSEDTDTTTAMKNQIKSTSLGAMLLILVWAEMSRSIEDVWKQCKSDRQIKQWMDRTFCIHVTYDPSPNDASRKSSPRIRFFPSPTIDIPALIEDFLENREITLCHLVEDEGALFASQEPISEMITEELYRLNSICKRSGTRIKIKHYNIGSASDGGSITDDGLILNTGSTSGEGIFLTSVAPSSEILKQTKCIIQKKNNIKAIFVLPTWLRNWMVRGDASLGILWDEYLGDLWLTTVVPDGFACYLYENQEFNKVDIIEYFMEQARDFAIKLREYITKQPQKLREIGNLMNLLTASLLREFGNDATFPFQCNRFENGEAFYHAVPLKFKIEKDGRMRFEFPWHMLRKQDSSQACEQV